MLKPPEGKLQRPLGDMCSVLCRTKAQLQRAESRALVPRPEAIRTWTQPHSAPKQQSGPPNQATTLCFNETNQLWGVRSKKPKGRMSGSPRSAAEHPLFRHHPAALPEIAASSSIRWLNSVLFDSHRSGGCIGEKPQYPKEVRKEVRTEVTCKTIIMFNLVLMHRHWDRRSHQRLEGAELQKKDPHDCEH